MATASGVSEDVEDAADSDYDDLQVPDEDVRDNSIIRVKVHLGSRWRKLAEEGVIIPYRAVHAPPQSFKTPNRKCFIAGRQVVIKVSDVERNVSNYMLNPNLYVLQIQHGEYSWTVKRRYKHFQHLHQQLQLYRATLSIPFPTKIHRERRSSYKSSKDETGKSKGLPRFPKRPDALVGSDQLEERRNALQSYLQNLLNIRAFRNHHETLEFLEVSHLSFVYGLGGKGKEGVVLKRTGTTHTKRCTFGICTCVNGSCFRMQRCCGEICGQWQRRWLIVKDTFVGYVRPKDGRLHCVMLMDPEFEVSSALYDTGVTHGVVISNLSRRLVLKCWTKRKGKEWLDYLRKATTTEVARGFMDLNRFGSYAPIRSQVDATWFVDGSDYMAAVADALEAAHEEIFISDWWLSPEIYMKRPIIEGERWRLDKILQRKAKDGVKIFIQLYKEVNLALGINSFYSKQKLVEMHPENIKVLRHPDHVSAGILLWAHHEKLVVVDQTYAFVGGIDLCYGRWDDCHHRLTDLGSVSTQQKGMGGMQKKMTSSKPSGVNASSLFHLAKATNVVTMGPLVDHQQRLSRTPSPVNLNADMSAGQNATNGVDEDDVKVTFSDATEAMPNGKSEVAGSESVESMSNLAEENTDVVTPLKGETPPTGRKNLFRKMTKVSRVLREDGKEWIERHIRRKGSAEEGSSEEDAEPKDDAGLPSESKHRSKRTTAIQMSKVQGDVPPPTVELKGSSKIWIGKDYTNFIVKDFADLDSPFTDLVDRSTTPRMPWHDIGVMVQGNAARDVARHFIQRWNASKDEKAHVNNSYPHLIPKSYDFRNEHVPPIVTERMRVDKVSCQIVRSASQWSTGIRMIEDSIQQAYIDSIEKARHYIYIENQFFITMSCSNQQVQNRIGEALLQRILRAHREKSNFRVFIIIPLLPGFEGEVGTNRGVAIHAITHWNYSSICRGPDALGTRLLAAGVEDPTQYMTIHGLRTHSELHGDLVTELIYVHSKLMIVDDNLVICGSANINDRSMIGKRDSEVAVVVQDETFVQSRMDGKDYKAGRFAKSLRMHLFREHLGLLECTQDSVDIDDPISESFYRNVWIHTAIKNTDIYDQVFHCVPTDQCQSFVDLRDYQEKHPLSATDPVAARTMLKDVHGHLVILPLKFLASEDLLPSTGTREALMPTSLWT